MRILPIHRLSQKYIRLEDKKMSRTYTLALILSVIYFIFADSQQRDKITESVRDKFSSLVNWKLHLCIARKRKGMLVNTIKRDWHESHRDLAFSLKVGDF